MRVVLIHWKPEEAAPRVRELADHGIEAVVSAPRNASEIRGVAAQADAVLIDLSRLPLQGRAVAIEFRKRVESRHVPIVFAGGSAAKVAEVQRLLPDAAYLDWDNLATRLPGAIAAAPEAPLVPGTMAGYSGTPLAKKLGIKENSVVALIGAPADFPAKLAPLPGGVSVSAKPRGAARIVLFVTTMKDFRKGWTTLTNAAAEGATLWIAWPKRASGAATELSETLIRAYGLENGWVDYKICAIDETWSGLAFARRKAAKAG